MDRSRDPRRRLGKYTSMVVAMFIVAAIVGSSIGAFAATPPRTDSNSARLTYLTNGWPEASSRASHAGSGPQSPVSSLVAPLGQRSTLASGATAAPFNVFDGLELTAEQHAQVRVLTQESREARKAIFARQRTGKAPSDADREELLRQAEAHNAAVRALLTPAQQARLAANFEVLRARHAEAQKAQFEAKRAATIRSAP